MYTLGFDIGSSSIKAAIVDPLKGDVIAAANYPEEEMPIAAPRPGWAEQDPEMWWQALVKATRRLLAYTPVRKEAIRALGISYQMHGLVLLDRDDNVLRPAIIWCDSRAVEAGEKLLKAAGDEYCFGHLLNVPGNFTAAKLAWVKENEPELFARAVVMMLPGDYIAFRLTGEKKTTVTGLSEGTLWDFPEDSPAFPLLEKMGISPDILPPLIPVFGDQGHLTADAAKALGLQAGIPVTYRAGDQPNNAFSLNVLRPGEVAATAGTSGVIYGVTDRYTPDTASRVNLFAHVNHTKDDPRVGILLCINGTGIQYAWLRKNVASGSGYPEMNSEAASVPSGSENLRVFPFGNGAERVLQNRFPGASVRNLDFNRHTRAHLLRAALEGIAFSLAYGLEVMHETGMSVNVIRAGHANMFLSPVFAQTLATVAGVPIELYNTDGATGAAMGAALGTGITDDPGKLFGNLAVVRSLSPEKDTRLLEAFENWKKVLINL
ncbi:MAG: carbohydrate kinase [Chlorobi bacterium]|nr:carbohydrate kinase [Chlorobiota bacterium]